MPELTVKDLGPCLAEYDGASIWRSLGSVTLKSEATFVDIKENQHGNAPVDAVLTGRVATIDVPMARSTLEQLAAVLPGTTLVRTELTFHNPVGGNMFDSALELILKPMTDQVASAVNTEWITAFAAFPVETMEMPFDVENQRVIMVTFKLFPSATSPNVGDLLKIGN